MEADSLAPRTKLSSNEMLIGGMVHEAAGRHVAVDKPESKYQMLRTSLRHNLQVYFDNSSLHGVRFIREEKRPFREKFLWFACTIIGGVATLIIIASLWEKFQTNPTITGLDTDFHNWDVPFPAVALCPQNYVDKEALDNFVQQEYKGEKFYKDFFHAATMMSLYNLENFTEFFKEGKSLPDISLTGLAQKFMKKCEDVLDKCLFKGPEITCCDFFKPLLTEVGPCLTFNTKYAWPEGKFNLLEILETDETLTLSLTFTEYDSNLTANEQTVPIYLLSYDEMPSVDTQPHATFDYMMAQVFFSEKHTYTTPDTRQLTTKQRRCAFADEIKLKVVGRYSYAFCMIQCRMQLSRSLCGCVAPFYPTTDGFRHCSVSELKCLVQNAAKLRAPTQCNCELGCDHTVYEIERLQDNSKVLPSVDVLFVSWPLIRYKREVLFGWVDLLVSFGGIAGLFLGFSLLSGVEILYYFTMRACCMACKNKEELRKMEQEHEMAPKPALDLSLTPYFKLPVGGGAARVHPVVPAAATAAVATVTNPYVDASNPHSVLRAQRVLGPYMP